jgi:O-antigen/teichoic acid export membrane protein
MLRDSALSLASTLARVLTSLVLFVAMADVWGPEQFGLFMYPYTIAAVLVKVVDYGFNPQLARDLGRAPREMHGAVSRALGAKVALLAPTALLAAIVALVLPAGGGSPVLLALLLCDAAASSFALLLGVPLRACGRFDDEARVAVATNGVLFAAVTAALGAGGGPTAVAAAFALARLGGAVASWRACARAIGAAPRPVLAWPPIRDMLRTGLPFGVHAAVGTLNMQVDTLMVHHYLGAGAVGIYQAGMRVLVGALLVADALNGVYLARLARTAPAAGEFDRVGTRMTRHLVALGVMAFAGTLAGTDLIVRHLFDDGYASLVQLLPAFGVLIFIRYGGVPYGTFLTLTDRQGVRTAAVSGVLLLSIALNALLIPRFGLPGAISASIAGHVALYSVYAVAAWHERGSLLIDRRALTLIGAALAAGLLLTIAPASVATRIQIGVALATVGAVVGVTRAEWGAVAGKFTRAT